MWYMYVHWKASDEKGENGIIKMSTDLMVKVVGAQVFNEALLVTSHLIFKPRVPIYLQ